MISILMLVLGILLEVVVKKHRQLFELMLINTTVLRECKKTKK